jgi:GntR family transcriptional regulator
VAAVSGQSPGLVRDSPVPLHSQLRHLLVSMIEEGQFRVGEPLPAERELAERFGVSLAPVRQAILDLVGEGVIYRVRGKGTFLREPSLVENVSILSSFTSSMRDRGLAAELRLLGQKRRRATSEVAAALGLAGRSAIVLERLALVEGEPVGLFTSHLSPTRFPEIGPKVAQRGSLWAVLEEEFGVVVVRSDSIVEVGRCATEHASLLQVPARTSLLIVQGTSYDAADQAVEAFHIRYRADRIRLRLDSHRNGAAGRNPHKKGEQHE